MYTHITTASTSKQIIFIGQISLSSCAIVDCGPKGASSLPLRAGVDSDVKRSESRWRRIRTYLNLSATSGADEPAPTAAALQLLLLLSSSATLKRKSANVSPLHVTGPARNRTRLLIMCSGIKNSEKFQSFLSSFFFLTCEMPARSTDASARSPRGRGKPGFVNFSLRVINR